MNQEKKEKYRIKTIERNNGKITFIPQTFQKVTDFGLELGFYYEWRTIHVTTSKTSNYVHTVSWSIEVESEYEALGLIQLHKETVLEQERENFGNKIKSETYRFIE